MALQRYQTYKHGGGFKNVTLDWGVYHHNSPPWRPCPVSRGLTITTGTLSPDSLGRTGKLVQLLRHPSTVGTPYSRVVCDLEGTRTERSEILTLFM